MQLTSLTSLQLAEGLRSKKFSSVEVTEAFLARIRATNEHVNSFISISEEQALEQAKAADLKLKAQGEDAPLLTGVPFAVKDLIITEGIETTCASKILQGFIPPYDSTVIKRLKQKHAVILGKTNLDEFAMGSSNEHSAFGPARNPHDLSRVPGGSSGGSAVAVALGQAPFSLGTDTGGSIRQPASFTGTIGLRPTYGRVSRYGVVAYASSLDQVGVFARTVDDVALVMSAIAGKDEHDSTSADVEVEDYLCQVTNAEASELKNCKIGVPKEYFSSDLNPEVSEAVKAALDKIANAGGEVSEISLPHTDYSIAAYYIIAMAEASSNLARYDGVRYGYRAKEISSLQELYSKTRSEGFGSEVKRRILLGTFVLSSGYYDAYYRKAQQVRRLVCEDFTKAFNSGCDLILTPVAPTTAFELNSKTSSPLDMYMADVLSVSLNMAGLPGITLPCGYDSKSLPIGFQLIAKPFAESMLLSLASVINQLIGFDCQACVTKDFN